MLIKVKFFGAFRQYGNGEALKIDLPQKMMLRDFRPLFFKKLKEVDASFNDEKLLSDSVFANETKVLSEDFLLESSLTLAILPPVCGG